MIPKSQIKFGSEVYTWFMNNNGQTYDGKLGHIIDVIARAGFTGIQPIHSWMGELADHEKLKEKLRQQNIELAAVSLVLEWNGKEETNTEKVVADQTIALLKHFPGAMLCTVQLPTGRHDIAERRKRLLNIVNEVSTRATGQGVPCTFHPNSPHSSITRTEEDYEIILGSLNSKVTGWTPDVGHIINAGMDPLNKMKEYASLINHVHYKDWDGEPEFILMGKGKVDFISITKWLDDIGYKGWIVCEDEGREALEDPDGVTLHDGHWIKDNLLNRTDR
ncbi:MAG: sugar phosphate isomerase/epimerase family protein [Ginsengibacter sp.]